MDSFLKQVANHYISNHEEQLSNCCFVFPNRRSSIFFTKYLGELIRKPIFSPSIITIADLVQSQTEIKQADQVTLLFDLYKIYIKHLPGDDTFDSFYSIGEMLLGDFDDLDKYCLDARQLYANLYALKEIDAIYANFEPEQIEYLRIFWAGLLNEKSSEYKKRFLKTWEKLAPIYFEFRQLLQSKNMGYEGMLFRDVAEKMEDLDVANFRWKKVVFVGLNALSSAEKRILSKLYRTNLAEFCWDYNAAFMNEHGNRAAHFMVDNVQQFPPIFRTKSIANPKPDFHFISTVSDIAQAEVAGGVIQRLIDDGVSDFTSTAIVLADETMLLSTLYNIPESISALNVTMGFPVKNSQAFALIDIVIQLYKNSRITNNAIHFYHKNVTALLHHPIVKRFAPENCKLLLKQITNENLIFVPQLHFAQHKIFSFLAQMNDAQNITNALIDAYQAILELLHQNSEAESNAPQEPQNENVLEKELYYFIYSKLKIVATLLAKKEVAISNDTEFRLIKRMLESSTIPFEGEPLNGLQVMGVLETRAVDFENIILVSCNEGKFPKSSVGKSMIPYNLRRGLGLPTIEFQDSIYAYYFYRLLQRAQKVYMVANITGDGINSGEKSRYYYQLKYLYQYDIDEKTLSYPIINRPRKEIVVSKSAEVMAELNQYLNKETRIISASALNCYLDCKLKFYLSYVKGLSEAEELNESIDHQKFGTIFHEVIEMLYKPFEQRVVPIEALEALKKNHPIIEMHIKNAMALNFFKKDASKVEIRGQHIITAQIIKKYILRLISNDIKLAPFTYIQGELRVEHLVEIVNNRVIKLGGIIDRVDVVDGKTRIIDYKTGKAEKYEMVFSQVADIFADVEKRPKYVFQTFFYGYLYQKLHSSAVIAPSIYFLRHFFDDKEDGSIMQKSAERGSEKSKVEDISPYIPEFETQLSELLSAIFDQNDVSFCQTEFSKRCAFCDFKTVCGR